MSSSSFQQTKSHSSSSFLVATFEAAACARVGATSCNCSSRIALARGKISEIAGIGVAGRLEFGYQTVTIVVATLAGMRAGSATSKGLRFGSFGVGLRCFSSCLYLVLRRIFKSHGRSLRRKCYRSLSQLFLCLGPYPNLHSG